MRKNYSNSTASILKQPNLIDFDTEKFTPSPESIKIYEELNAIAEEIETCRKRNIS